MLENVKNPVTGKTFVKQAAVTYERVPYNPSLSMYKKIINAGTARANMTPSLDSPQGGQNDYAEAHRQQTVLQQHWHYFDPDGDGVVWAIDTYRGFRNLGFNLFLSIFAVLIIHSNFSYPTSPSVLPDPFFRVWLNDIHKAKHGNDSGTFDNEGCLMPQKFEDVFSEYGKVQGGLTILEIWDVLKGQSILLDPIGWFGTFFEWTSLYLLLWPEDGVIRKEDVRRVYDGSIFSDLSVKRSGKVSAT